MKKRITQDDYIKANRKASREEEIESHGHPVSYNRVHQSKKVYNRKMKKAEDKALPFFVSASNRSSINKKKIKPKSLLVVALNDYILACNTVNIHNNTRFS